MAQQCSVWSPTKWLLWVQCSEALLKLRMQGRKLQQLSGLDLVLHLPRWTGGCSLREAASALEQAAALPAQAPAAPEAAA